MTPQTQTTSKTVQKTVFDLTNFDDVKLVKTVTLPTPVTSVEEALAAVGNDASALLAVINDGLAERAVEQARADLNEWFPVLENGDKAAEPYTGKFADEDKSKLINNAVLTLAKMQAGGSWDSMNAEQKRAKKSAAIEFLRANPAMLASIQG